MFNDLHDYPQCVKYFTGPDRFKNQREARMTITREQVENSIDRVRSRNSRRPQYEGKTIRDDAVLLYEIDRLVAERDNAKIGSKSKK